MMERFLEQLSAQEQTRVKQVVDILDAFPVYPGDWLWVIGTGSVVRRDPHARDIDIAVWTKQHQLIDLNRYLQRSFEEYGLEYESNGVFLGLPRLLRKDQRWITPTNRPIELFVTTVTGYTPQEVREVFLESSRLPVVELLNKDVSSS